MSSKPVGSGRNCLHIRLAAAILLAATCWTTSASAQTETAQPLPDKPTPAEPARLSDNAVAPMPEGNIAPAGCATCGSGAGVIGSPGLVGESCGAGCAGGCCTPGQFNPCCNNWCGDSCGGKILGNIIQCICCPDPCYEPHWNALADAAFFADAPRPITQMRFRWDSAWDLPHPDKAEFFWARADGNGKGPSKFNPASLVDYSDFNFYTEAATGRIGAFVEMPYRFVKVQDPTATDNFPGHSGFADMNAGTKTLLLDCELTQLSFQFRTFIPIGSPGNGLGTGHVSLEPSLLGALRLTPTTYLQTQLAYWIPIGGDPAYQGPVFHYHNSLNQLLWRCCNVQVIGMLEMDGWEIMGGAYTDETGVQQGAKHIGSIFSMGPGIRAVICDKIDVGVGSRFAIGDRKGEDVIRAELRWRF